MDLLQLLQATGQQDKIIATISKQFGLDSNQTNQAITQILGALGGSVQSNVAQQGGVQSLMKALNTGHHDHYIEAPEQAVQNSEDGNKILGHILGSKEASRTIATEVEQSSGVQADIIKKMLPVIAMMAMGAMSKGAQANGNKPGIGLDDVMAIAGLLQGNTAGAGSQAGSMGGAMGALGGILKMLGGARR